MEIYKCLKSCCSAGVYKDLCLSYIIISAAVTISLCVIRIIPYTDTEMCYSCALKKTAKSFYCCDLISIKVIKLYAALKLRDKRRNIYSANEVTSKSAYGCNIYG